MTPKAPFVVLSADAARLIRTAPSKQGRMRLRRSDADEQFVADQIETTEGVQVGVRIGLEFEALRWGDTAIAGQWSRTQNLELAANFLYLGRRPGAALPFTEFRKLVPSVDDPGEKRGLVIVHHPNLPEDVQKIGVPEFTGWVVTRTGVEPFDVAAEPQKYGPIQLASASRLQQNTVTVVGVGSIGSAAVVALNDLGFGRINLVDHDRFLWHNIIRHHLGPESVGRFKVDALKSALDARSRPFTQSLKTSVVAHRIDVVERADQLHRLLRTSDVVLCAADGIAPRRAVNHIASVTRTPAIFACVLEDGGIGEVVRFRPGARFGCLSCHRAALEEANSLDPEADQELAYGTGNPHRPMSASPSDLRLMGAFAAKMTAATVLESLHGETGQRLENEQMIIGLRPGLQRPAPFNVAYAGEVRWNPIPPPRADCATCSLA